VNVVNLTVCTCVQKCRRCHPLCDGCVGPVSKQCKVCTGYKEENDCVESCASGHYTDEQSGRCIPCDPQCAECRGITAADCTSCVHMKLYDDLDARSPDSPVSDVSFHLRCCRCFA